MWPSLRPFILPATDDNLCRLGLLAVGVAGALAAGDAPGAALARRGRAADLYPAHRALAELGVEPGHEDRREQPDLGRPGRRVGGHREFPVGEAIRAGVRSQVVADDLRPEIGRA